MNEEKKTSEVMMIIRIIVFISSLCLSEKRILCDTWSDFEIIISL